jgi:hypothetical protein
LTLDCLNHLFVADKKAKVGRLKPQKAPGDKAVQRGICETEIARLLGVYIADPGTDAGHLALELFLELPLRNAGPVDLGDLIIIGAGRDHVANAPDGEADDQQNGQDRDDDLANTFFHFLEQHSSSSTFP